ncbi:MAG TPA: hypothetical protein VFZ04_17850 [Longimicrobiales bacterium]
MERSASVASEANRLYWQTERSIADISETLGISRRALYELVTPENAGASCDSCGGEVVYINRSAKTSATARCPACGTECQITTEEVDEPLEEETVPPYAAGWPRAVQRPRAQRSLTIGVGLMAGVAVGALLAFMIARRRR